jgi:O-antigen/teichoic acid export membrane protein
VLNQTSATSAVANQFESNGAEHVVGNRLRWSWLDQVASSRFRRLSREFLWIGLGQTAAVLGAVLGIRVLTSVLSQEAYGQLALGMTAATFINLTVFGPLANGATRFFAAAREADRLHSYLSAVKNLVLHATGIVLLMAMALWIALVLTGQSEWVGLALAAVFFGLLSGYNSALNGMQNAARQRPIVALHQGLASWGRFLLALSMVLWFGPSSTVAMLGYGLAILLVVASQGWFFRRTVSGQTDGADSDPYDPRQWRADLLRYAWPFAVWGVPAWAHFVSDRWALQVFCSTQDVALYAALFQLGYYPVTVATALITQLLAPVYFERAGDGRDEHRIRGVYSLNWHLTLVIIALTLLMAVVAACFHGVIFAALVPADYRSVSWLLPGLVLSGGLFAAGQVVSLSLHVGVQTYRLVAPQVAVAISGAAINLIAAMLFGVRGVVGAGILISTAYVIWVVLLAVAHRGST